MIALLLIFISSFFGEITQSIAKYEVKKKHETIYAIAFLTCLVSVLILSATVLLGVEFKLVAASIPFIALRIITESINMELAVRAIAKAERSTFALLRLATIPFLLTVDLFLGYEIATPQIMGVLIVFIGLTAFLSQGKKSRKGAVLVLSSALMSVVTISLYKYNVTHFNSAAAEQIVVIGFLLVYSYFRSKQLSKISPFRILKKRFAQGQAISAGAAEVLWTFAVPYVAASIATASLRAMAAFWAILFGRKYFHEKSTKSKLAYLLMTATGVYLLTISK